LKLVHLSVIAICSVLAGRAAAHLIVGSWLADGPPLARQRPPPVEKPAHSKDPSAILSRNVFCSGCESPQAVAAEEHAREQGAEGPQKSALPVALLSILFSGPSDSLAVIADLSKQKQKPIDWFFRRGELLFETGATVAAIGERRVYLRNGTRLEYLDLDEQLPAPAPGAPARVAVASNEPDLDRGLHCSGNSCQADRSLIDQLLQNPMALATQARFVPSLVAGKANGFKVYAIRPGSLFEKIGLQNGDTVKSINGLDMTSPDKALEVYTKLRNASHLSVVVDRRGQGLTMDYTIR
jgi:general secretion pathway protein C